MAYEMFQVLLVDDDPVIIRLYEKQLRDNHYQVLVAADGEQALLKAFQERPDVIILDIMMPKINGYEVCARLRAAPSTADIPIMILTSMEGIPARQKAREMGADDYVTKGEATNSIDGRIKMLLKNRLLAHTRSRLANLPGRIIAEHALWMCLAQRRPFALCYLDLKGLDEFNRRAGFQEGDRVLWQLAHILVEQVKKDAQGDFVGHLCMDDFQILTAPDRAETLARAVLDSFDATMLEWSGGSASTNWFPTLAIAIVVVEGGENIHPAQIFSLGRALLKEAKTGVTSAIRAARL